MPIVWKSWEPKPPGAFGVYLGLYRANFIFDFTFTLLNSSFPDYLQKYVYLKSFVKMYDLEFVYSTWKTYIPSHNKHLYKNAQQKEENDRTPLLYLFPSLYFYWARNRKTLAETSFIPHDLSLTSQTLSQISKTNWRSN